MAVCLLLAGCSGTGNGNSQSATPEPEVKVGGDSDDHGCIASAGYQWSVLKNECIRTFEAGTRLDPVAEELDSSLSAFVVFKAPGDDAKAEIYLPGQTSSLLLDKSGSADAPSWKNDAYMLSQNGGTYVLADAGGKPLYEGAGN